MAGLTIFPGASVDTAAIEAQVAEVKATADAAVAAAANARQMVLNRDVTLTDLKATASQFGSVTAAADAIHAQLEQELIALRAALANVQTTPGPAGLDGAAGTPGTKGDKGDTGTAGAKGADGAAGATGPSGTANLAIGLAPVGLVALGGNTTVVVPLAKTLTAVPTNVQVAHSAVLNLATATIAVTAKTTSSVTVKVSSAGVAVAAGTLLVLAF